MIKVPIALVRELRARLRDYPEWNYLEKNEESKDQQLARLIYEALESFNVLAPILDHWDFTTLPRGSTHVIMNLAVVRVLQEVSIWMVRNEYQYQSGNTSVRLYDKWKGYQTLLRDLKAEANEQAKLFKIQMNINGAWGYNLTEMYDAHNWEDPKSYIELRV